MHAPFHPEKAPPAAVPRRFFSLAVVLLPLALFLQFLWAPSVAAAPVMNPRALVVVHLYVLGFAVSAAYGALYQYTAAVLGARAGRRGLTHWWLHLLGLSSMVLGFYRWLPLFIAAGGALVLSGVFVLVVPLVGTLRKHLGSPVEVSAVPFPEDARKSKAEPPSRQVAAYLAWALPSLALAMTWGVVLALSYHYGWILPGGTRLGIHLWLGVGGWFSLLGVGISYELIPMFTLLPKGAPRHRRLVRLLVLGAVSLGVLTPWLGGVPQVLALLPALYAAVFFSLDWRRLWQERRKVRLDLTGQAFVGALVSLTGGLLVVLFAPAVGVYLLLWGWAGSLIFGHVYRVAAFVLWFPLVHHPRPGVKPPRLADMFSLPPGHWAVGCWLAGVGFTAAGLLMRSGLTVAAGAAIGLAAALLLAYGYWEMLQKGR